MNSTVIILLSSLGLSICIYLIVYFLRILNNQEILGETKFSMIFISLGSFVAFFYFVYNLLISCCLNKVTKCFSHICSILLIIIAIIFIIFSSTLLKQNHFEDDELEMLRPIEEASNCCGWKTVKLENCRARFIHENIQSCYDVIGSKIDASLTYLKTFYFAFLIFIIIMLICVIMTDNTNKENEENMENKNGDVVDNEEKNTESKESKENDKNKEVKEKSD